MIGILLGIKRLLGFEHHSTGEAPPDRAVVPTSSRCENSSDPPEINLCGVPYIPLPPSPPSWELRQEGDKEFHEAYKDPAKRAVISAYWQKQYTKVVSLIETVPPTERTGYLGHTFAKAYRNLVQTWRNKDRPSVALKWSSEMLEKLPDLVDDTDRRRHNKLVGEATSTGQKTSFAQVEVPQGLKPKASRFAAIDGCPWVVDEEAALNKSERPDPAFDDIQLSANGVLFIDAAGKSGAFPGSKSAIRVRDREGALVAEAGLPHDIYRFSISPASTAFATMSSECGLYVYDERLQPVFTKNLASVATRKNHIRCVDVSPATDRVLYTAVDRAWCVDLGGHELWAVKMPPKAGWEKVVERVNASGTNEEVQEALDLLGLAFPFEPEDVRQRYRHLATQWHPDRNPNDPLAHERTQQLNSAYEVLTGEKAQIQVGAGERVYYRQVMQREHVELPDVGVGFDFEISMIGPGEDWIYASCFSSRGGAYLGAYSGRVVEVSPAGKPLRTYDIGCVPCRIVEIGKYLYLVAGTRLYVLTGGKLQRMVDIFDKGDLMLGQTGFGLLAPKRFRWFNADGIELGGIETEHPIRRVYPSGGGLAIETRQHRAIVSGVPEWWHATKP